MEKNYPTAHINAVPEDFAPTVLMPGDPLRSQFIAENFLENSRLVNNIRGVQGYTGYYQGQKISVMASGMGMPSIGIYSYELFRYFGVQNIIRIGTIGTISPEVHVKDIILAMGASTDSNFARQFQLPGIYAPTSDFSLLQQAVKACEKQKVPYHVGNIVSSDVFYNQNQEALKKWSDMHVLGFEMETAALYMTAAYLNKKALAVLTVSNHLVTGEETTAEERQNSFTDMMKAALDTAVSIQKKSQAAD